MARKPDGKKPGGTQVTIWDDAEKAQVIDLIVQVDVGGPVDGPA